MATDVVMPALGMAQDSGRLVRWLHPPGAQVTAGEPLMEIETDKVTVEIEAPADGVLAGVRAAEGSEVPVGEVVAVILAPDERESAAAPPPARQLASPKARRLARERGVPLAALRGSGPHGAVVATDVEAASSGASAAARTPPSGAWQTMAARVSASWRSAPHFHLRREVDATRLLSWRAAAVRRSAQRITITDLLVRVVAGCLREHPALNARWRDERPTPSSAVNVGVAVATDDGLVVPVLQGADELTLAQIAARRSDLAERARSRRLRPEDVRDGSFTLSNLGMLGVDSFDAILNDGQAGILAVGRIRERVVPAGGAITVRPQLALGLTLDHRLVDGARGAAFLEAVAELLEEPAGLVDS